MFKKTIYLFSLKIINLTLLNDFYFEFTHIKLFFKS